MSNQENQPSQLMNLRPIKQKKKDHGFKKTLEYFGFFIMFLLLVGIVYFIKKWLF